MLEEKLRALFTSYAQDLRQESEQLRRRGPEAEELAKRLDDLVVSLEEQPPDPGKPQ